MDIAQPRVGVGLLLIKGNRVLFGKRKGSHGHGEYGGAGGHLEPGETFEQAIMRELEEEAGPQVKIDNLRFLCVTNVLAYAPKHYIDIGMIADWVSGEPTVMEPHKLEAWEWHEIDNPPSPLFSMVPNYIEAYQTGKVYFSD